MTDRKKTRALAIASRAASKARIARPALAAATANDTLSPALYRQIVEVSANGVLVLDARAHVRFANARIATLTGYAAAAIQGRSITDFLIDVSVDELLPPSPLGTRDVKFRRADGTFIWTLCALSALTDARGRDIGTLAVIADITARKQAEENLRASEHRLRTLVDNEPECVKLMDAEGRLLHINHAGLHMIEADTAEEVLGKSVYGLIDPKDRDGYRRLHQSAMRGGTGCIQFEIITLKGVRRWLETTVAPFPSETDGMLILGITRDISERHRAEAALRKSDELLRLVLRTLPIGVWVFDAQHRVLMDNPAGAALLAESDTSVNEDIQAHCNRAVVAALTTGAAIHNDVVEYTAATGRRTILHSAVPIRDGDGKVMGAVAVKQDVSDYRHAQERIHYLASYDPLTGLANRRLFNERLHNASVADAHGGAVLLLDLDRFKTINESLGHEAGDELLRAIAQRLTRYLHADDTLAHLSGDEFGLLLPRPVAIKEVEAFADTLLGAIAEPVRIGEREFFVSGSMGIALYPRDGADAPTVLRHADAALYRAKAQGRNTYQLYAQQPHKGALDKLNLERELRLAIERQEFILHYQPQLDIHSGRVVGAEALVRWNHGTLGMISPAAIYPARRRNRADRAFERMDFRRGLPPRQCLARERTEGPPHRGEYVRLFV